MLSAAEVMMLAEELDQLLGGARLQKIHGPREDCFTLEFHRHDGTRKLLVALERGFVRAHLSTREFTNPERPSEFVADLRREILNARLLAVRSLKNERILRVDLATLDADGKPAERRLYLELFARSRNLVLTDEKDRIVLLLREGGEKRPALAKGRVYVPPERRADLEVTTPPVPFAWLESRPPAGGLSPALEAWVAPRETESKADQRRDALLVELRRRIKKDERLRQNLESDVQDASRAEALRRQAELLKQNLGSIPQGATSIEVTEWKDDQGTPLVLELDPKERPVDVVARLFREAKKLETSWARASTELGLCEDRLKTLSAAAAEAENATAEALDALFRRAEQAGWLPRETAAPSAPKKSSEPAPRLPYKTYLSKDGIEILVGRTASDNDELTFEVAKGADLWLHVADYPGSHVLIRTGKLAGDLPEQTLLDAATLAAHFSQAPKGSHPSISYTRAKFVKKFKGAKPGQVQLAERKTLKLRPEPDRLARLLTQR